MGAPPRAAAEKHYEDMAEYGVIHSGDENTTDYRLYITRDGKPISIFHDIPLVAREENGERIFNFIVEIPRGTSAKMEIAPGEQWNPIKQDVKKGKLRHVDDVHPYSGYIWNYGAFPQTWEDPTHKHPETGCFGDNDPLDVCEIGSEVGYRGQIKQVKVLGVIALIDEGETDWKVIVIDVNDERASQLNDMDDVRRVMPGFSFAVYEWLRTYKMPAGKPPNEFAFEGAARDKAYALEVVDENHRFWRRVVTNEIPPKAEKYNIAVANVSVDGSPYKTDSPTIEAAAHVQAPAKVARSFDVVDVKTHVESSQIQSPHGDSGLSAAVARAADAIFAGSVDGLSDDSGVYKYFSSTKDNAAVIGIYRAKTPHASSFSLSEALEDLEIVGAAYGTFGESFTYTTGVGRSSYTKGDSGFVPSDNDFALPDTVNGGDCIRGERAPLAFLRERS